MMTPEQTLPRSVHVESSLPAVRVVRTGSLLRRLAGFIGPGFLVAVGYMDPGNWATGLAGGSAYGYSLLWVILLSNLMAMVLQVLAARLGLVTGMDLASACRARFSRRSSLALWVLAELAICATDLAEVIGSAIALELLFGVPLVWGVALTILDVLLVLWISQRSVRYLELLTAGLIAIILGCFAIDVGLARPDVVAMVHGLIPSATVVREPRALYLAIGILGATVMPHNLYLHSSLVQTRRVAHDERSRREGVRFASWDVILALLVALFINAGILILSAASFHRAGYHEVVELSDAYHLLSPVIGTGVASSLFAIALLASGKSSTITATLTGQVVMEGFVRFRLSPWLRRLMTRAVVLVPALFAVLYFGERGLSQLLILSQAVLSMQLPFAVVPLVRITSDRTWMGSFASPRWLGVLAWAMTIAIIVLNASVLINLARA